MILEPDDPDREDQEQGSAEATSKSRRNVVVLAVLALAVIVVAAVLVRGSGSTAQSRIAIVGQQLLTRDLDRQAPTAARYWERYQDGDAPEGGFMGWMKPGADNLDGRVALGRTIQPGDYRLFVKARNYGHPLGVTFSLGGARASIKTSDDDNKDDNGFWSKPISLKVTKATDELSLRLARIDGSKDKEKLLLRGIYLTPDADEIVTASDRVVALHYPKTTDTSAPRGGNLVENGSFETGIGHGWGGKDDRRFSMASIWDPTTGKDGHASLRLPLDPSDTASGPTGADQVTLVSKPYAVAPNKKHTLSMWVRSEDGTPVKGQIALINSFAPPAAPKLTGRQPPQLKQSFHASGTWTRVDLTGVLVAYPTADYNISISADLAAGRHLWVDGVSLNEGGPAPYQAKLPLEIGVQRTQPSNLYYDDAPVQMTVRAYNASAATLQRNVHYEVYDYLNRRVLAGERSFDVAARSVQTRDFDLSTGKRGAYRLVMWVDGENGSDEEIAYGVVPRPRRSGADPGSLIGTHSNFTAFQDDAMARLGIKWDRAMSPGSFFRWAQVEPQQGKFVWFDPQIDLARQRGVSVLGTLGYNAEWPKFADDDGHPDLAKWEQFVERLVSHYRGKVAAWEIWNEPNYVFKPAFYAQLLKRAAEAIKRADPAAKVVAMGGANDVQFSKDVFAQLHKQFPHWPWRKYIDTISMHMYPARSEQEPSSGGRAASFRKDVLPVYKLPVWNTESGEWDSGFYRTSNAVRPLWGTSLFGDADAAQFAASSPHAIQSVSQTFLETIGNGLSKFFYYDFRVQASPTYVASHPTMLEYDDTIRPKGIAYAILAYLFDHSRGLGRIGVGDSHTQAYLFDRGGVPLVGLYTTDDQPRTITLHGIGGDRLHVYDVMGNRVTTKDGKIAYGDTPVYIEAPGTAVGALEKALHGASVARRQDTQPPSASIDDGPRGPVDSSAPVQLRWSATDDISIPSDVDPAAITYKYRVHGLDGHDAWSAWSTTDETTFASLPKGSYRLDVRAKDSAGNRSTVVSRAIDVR
ncbi:MAG TPA: triple tyrosine motif-containing protein [Solirubrobacteraceae bacterium]|nr:triple tyrosine motif-containing protein [Solirubrobacteraceae bacterium]